jgi:uncharacterized membrane protein
MSARRAYLDWLRGLAVLIMIEAHIVDSWTADEFRESSQYAVARVVGGFGAPLFLFLAGVAVALSASAQLRRGVDQTVASSAVIRRGLQLFVLAFLFRFQAWVLGWSSPLALLKVDILNIMGPSIAAAGVLWALVRSGPRRLAAFSVATVVLALLTPLILAAPLNALPDPIEAYIQPIPYLSHFVFFPWGVFVLAGVIPGLLLDVAPAQRERRTNVWLVVGGLAIATISFAAAYLPTAYPSSDFWTSSPCFFFLRVGLMTAAIGAAFAWESRPAGARKWSPLRQLGRSSLFVYWIHVELVYGLISRPLHHSLTLTEALAALGLFSVAMLGCSIVKDRVVSRWRDSRRGQMGTVPDSRELGTVPDSADCVSAAEAIYNRPS